MSKINYDLSLIKGIAFDIDGVLAPSTCPMGPDGVPLRMVNTKDGYALQLAVKKGIKMAIISGAVSEACENRFRILKIDDVYMGASTKLHIFEEWLSKTGLKSEEVAYMGDDIPDLEIMGICGLPVAPADAVQEVKDAAKFITRATGGYGCVRELLEEVMKANGLWLNRHDAFGW